MNLWRLLVSMRKPAFPPGMQVGEGCRVWGKPRLTVAKGAQIILGERVTLNSEPLGYHAGMPFPVTLSADRPGARIEIGSDSRLHGCCIHAWSQIRIGRKCLFAGGSQVLDANGHVADLRYARLRTTLRDDPLPIEIGDFCWLALGALVLKGARIGEGCVIAAYSVVGEGEYPPFSLIAGSPGRVIRTLDPTEVLPENFDLNTLDAERPTNGHDI